MADIKRIECGARMSEAVVYNGMIWLAGQVGEPGTSVAEQTKAILASVDRLLAEAGPNVAVLAGFALAYLVAATLFLRKQEA